MKIVAPHDGTKMFLTIMRLRFELSAERRQRQAAEFELAELRGHLNALASESDGVAGWHLNGDIATWDEFPELFEAPSGTGE